MQTPPAERTAREEARLNQRAREELALLGMHSAISTASGTGSAAPTQPTPRMKKQVKQAS